MGLGGIRQGGYGMATVGLIKPLFLRRYVRGGRLTSHEYRGKSSECLCELIQTDLNGSYSQHFLIWRVSSKIITNRVFSLLGSGSKTICIYKYIFEIHVYIYIYYTHIYVWITEYRKRKTTNLHSLNSPASQLRQQEHFWDSQFLSVCRIHFRRRFLWWLILFQTWKKHSAESNSQFFLVSNTYMSGGFSYLLFIMWDQ